MMESKGLDVIDLGVDVSSRSVYEYGDRGRKHEIIACSALLMTTMPVMKEVVDKANEKGVKGQD